MNDVAKEITSASADLRAALGASSIDTGVGVMRELVTVKPPYPTALVGAALAVGAASPTSFDPSKLTAEQALVGLGVASAVTIASAVVSLVTARKNKLRESPYAYLYLAERAGIVDAQPIVPADRLRPPLNSNVKPISSPFQEEHDRV